MIHEALSKFKPGSYDLVILDIKMPKDVLFIGALTMEQQALMRYSKHIANDFWFEFDIVSAPSLSLDVRISNDYATLFPNYFFDRLLLLWWRSHRNINNNTNYPEGNVNSIGKAMRYSVKDLMNLQCEIIDKHFHNDKGSR